MVTKVVCTKDDGIEEGVEVNFEGTEVVVSGDLIFVNEDCTVDVTVVLSGFTGSGEEVTGKEVCRWLVLSLVGYSENAGLVTKPLVCGRRLPLKEACDGLAVMRMLL